jgi:diguanylate cyclase (GGDEF)-like protein/PAS domain S-box-containing protein
MTEPAPSPDPEEEAAPSTDPFRRMAEAAPIGMVAATMDGTVRFANARWREMTGIDHPTPIPYEVVEPIIHPDDVRDLAQAYQQSGEWRRDFEVASRIIRADGEVRHVLAQGAPVIGADGVLTGYVGITVDITDLVEMTAAQRKSDHRFRSLISKAPLGQSTVGLDGNIIEANGAWAKMLGRTTDELIGMEGLPLVHPDDQPEAQDMAFRLLKGEAESIEQERRLVRPDGSVVWVSSSTTVERDANGKPVSFFALALDISDRKAAEEALRKSESRYRKLIDDAPVGQLLCTIDGELLHVNRAFLDMMGADLETLRPHVRGGILHPDDAEPYYRAIRQLRRGEIDRIERERRIVRPDGEVIWVSGGTTMIEEDGQRVLHSIMEDITSRKVAIEALTESENRFRTLTESIPAGVYQADIEGNLNYVNPQWREITRMGADPTTYREAMAPVHPDDYDRVAKGLLDALTSGGVYRDQYRIIDSNGFVRWIRNQGAATTDESGTITGIIGSVEDVTELVVAQEQNSRLAEIVETTSDLVGMTDVQTGKLLYLNRAARETFGLVDRDVTVISGASLYTKDSLPIYQGEILPALRRGERWTGELPMYADDGREILVWQAMTPILRADGSIDQLSTVGRDVTERKRFESDLAHQATHDSLTGLPNRALLLDHLELELARAERESRLVALLFLDLDRFKQVNDTLGHDAGDELLRQAAQRISSVVRPADTVARMGGDEFVILCGDVEDQDHATSVAQRVSAAIDSRPFDIGGADLPITSSIGIALSSGNVHPEAILRDADAAMYRAKDLGRARLEIYDESMRRRTAHRLELSEELATGIENGEIVVRFQPVVDLHSGRVTSVEALARWDHPTRGVMIPHEFIGLAEETGLIVGLGLRVLSTACEYGRRWEQRFGTAAPRVHVNLSARQLTTTNLPVLVQGVLDGSGLTPANLCLEITESVLMDDASAVINTLWELKAIGVALAIDDFGTGYSSLSYLRRFPVDVLKVDQSFVSGLGPDPEDSTIVAAIVNLANTLELEAIAEGVETFDQIERLRGLGCHLAQGYYFAKPDEPDPVTAMVAEGFRI